MNGMHFKFDDVVGISICSQDFKNFPKIIEENFVNLEEIVIEKCSMEAIDLKNFKNLRKLWISESGIREIGEKFFDNNENLEEIVIVGNAELTKIEIKAFEKLKRLKVLKLFANECTKNNKFEEKNVESVLSAVRFKCRTSKDDNYDIITKKSPKIEENFKILVQISTKTKQVVNLSDSIHKSVHNQQTETPQFKYNRQKRENVPNNSIRTIINPETLHHAQLIKNSNFSNQTNPKIQSNSSDQTIFQQDSIKLLSIDSSNSALKTSNTKNSNSTAIQYNIPVQKIAGYLNSSLNSSDSGNLFTNISQNESLSSTSDKPEKLTSQISEIKISEHKLLENKNSTATFMNLENSTAKISEINNSDSNVSTTKNLEGEISGNQINTAIVLETKNLSSEVLENENLTAKTLKNESLTSALLTSTINSTPETAVSIPKIPTTIISRLNNTKNNQTTMKTDSNNINYTPNTDSPILVSNSTKLILNSSEYDDKSMNNYTGEGKVIAICAMFLGVTAVMILAVYMKHRQSKQEDNTLLIVNMVVHDDDSESS